MRSFQRMGEEWARPGMGVRQRIFLPFSTVQVVGAGARLSTPPAWGPRNWGQLSAGVMALESAAGNGVKGMQARMVALMTARRIRCMDQSWMKKLRFSSSIARLTLL